MRRITTLGTTAVLTGGLAAGIWAAETPPQTTPDASAATAVDALATMPPAAAARHLPADFTAVNGYRPRITQGHLVDPTGGCSSPVPLPAEFDLICRQHDLGYDLLRTADATGGTLPASARHEVDHMFSVDAHRACADRGDGLSRSECDAWADIATGALEFNSWRQHWSTPSPETPVSVLAIAAAIASVISGVAAAVCAGRALASRLRKPHSLRLPEGAQA